MKLNKFKFGYVPLGNGNKFKLSTIKHAMAIFPVNSVPKEEAKVEFIKCCECVEKEVYYEYKKENC